MMRQDRNFFFEFPCLAHHQRIQVKLRLAYHTLLRDLQELIIDLQLSPRRLFLQAVLDEHQKVTLYLICNQNLLRVGFCFAPCDLDIEYLVFRVFEVELLGVAKVGRDALEWLPNLLVNQVDDARGQGLQGDDLEGIAGGG